MYIESSRKGESKRTIEEKVRKAARQEIRGNSERLVQGLEQAESLGFNSITMRGTGIAFILKDGSGNSVAN